MVKLHIKIEHKLLIATQFYCMFGLSMPKNMEIDICVDFERLVSEI